MNIVKKITEPMIWFTSFMLVAVAAGCGGGDIDPILGGGGSVILADARPRVTVTSPAASAVGVATNRKVTATFSEAMDPATLNSPATSFQLTCANPCVSPTGNTVSYSASGNTATFTPGSTLAINTTYTATITTAARDMSGSALGGNQGSLPAASNYVWTFTTGATTDVVAPTISSTNPMDAASGVPVNSSINATFDEAMDQATIDATTFTLLPASGPAIAGTFSYDLASNIATFTPTSDLAASTVYTATVISGASGVLDLAGNTLSGGVAPNPWSFTTGASGVYAQGTVALGVAGSFGIMATAAITNTGNSIINGDLSLQPGSSMTGFPPGIVNGAVHINDSVATQARNDLLAAYNYAKGLPPGTTISGGADLGALYITGMPPGTYTSGSTMLVSTPLTLDAGGDANAVWVFQIGSSLTTSANVSLANGAQAKNVFWVPTLDATVGVGTVFSGTIVSGRDVTAVTGATVNGRILAGATTAGTIALQTSTVNVPAQ